VRQGALGERLFRQSRQRQRLAVRHTGLHRDQRHRRYVVEADDADDVALAELIERRPL
jgi:hypothetical protein